MNKDLLTRTESSAMRGIAILAIMLHNYCHWLPMVQENEYTFTQHNVDRLMYEMTHPTLNLLAHLLSFFGHYGVPVFVFLSAYGLVMKYEKGKAQVRIHVADAKEESSWHFFWAHYKKLFLMMVTGYTAFVLVDYMTPAPRHYEFWNVVGQLGMFSNLYADPDHVIWPGPYWYFGLMVQIYLVYRFVLYKGKGSLGGLLHGRAYDVAFWLLAITLYSLQGAFEPESQQLEWYRYNAMGSLPVFMVGLWYARSTTLNTYPRWYWAVSAVIAVAMIIGGSLSFNSWMWVPFIICFGTIAIVKLLPQFLLNPLAWVGSISAMIFVCHPITRKVIIPISRRGDIYAGLLLYLVATIVLAILFKKLFTPTPTKH